MAKKETEVNETKPEEELSYAEILRRREDEDRYLAEQRANTEEKTGCLGISSTVLVGTFCIAFLIGGLGAFGYGISCFFTDSKEISVQNRIIMIVVGLVVTVATIFVWRMFYRNLHNDE